MTTLLQALAGVVTEEWFWYIVICNVLYKLTKSR